MVYPALDRNALERAASAIIAPPLATSLVVQYPRPRRPEQPVRTECFEHLDFTAPITIGRNGHIAINDPFLGERHAELVPTPAGLAVRAFDTTNGTFVNGRRIGEEVLRVGDVIALGQERLWFLHKLPGTPWPSRAVALLDAIRAAPADDAPRMVLADLLSELGDPRGEFIACQLGGAHERVDQLLAAQLDWAGPFIVPVHRWTFHRGFVDELYVDDLDDAAPLRVDHPFAELRLARPLVE
jgi:uncharacterized protein (TIGR02996 family)